MKKKLKVIRHSITHNITPIATSIAIVATGYSIMFNSNPNTGIHTIGGGLFMVGLIVFSLTVFNILKPKNGSHNINHKP